MLTHHVQELLLTLTKSWLMFTVSSYNSRYYLGLWPKLFTKHITKDKRKKLFTSTEAFLLLTIYHLERQSNLLRIYFLRCWRTQHHLMFLTTSTNHHWIIHLVHQEMQDNLFNKSTACRITAPHQFSWMTTVFHSAWDLSPQLKTSWTILLLILPETSIHILQQQLMSYDLSDLVIVFT